MVKRKLSAKEEMFCRAMALAPSNGMTQRECYIKAYNTENMTDETTDVKASIVAKKDKIGARIEALTKEFAAFLNYDAKAHFEELEAERKFAKQPSGRHFSVNASAAIKAVELKGKMTGRYIDKHEVTGKDGRPLIPTRILILGLGDDKKADKKADEKLVK